MRVYLPLTVPRLAELHRTGAVAPAPVTAHAVTPALRAWDPGAGDEELEYEALGRAAHAALAQLVADPAAPPRRVVLAADVPDGVVRPGSPADPEAVSEVVLDAVVPLADIAAVHVDADDAADVVAAAVAVLAEPGRGGDAPRSAVDDAEDHELLWYGVQEIDTLL
ncbi:DUF6912 family protein [Streptomyces spiramenti]|uniref:Uncharacterized protein n=1 Tax=Streptomyces spiramenti TaxID=2720606 RepID=A0ABX1APJ1_9ACTN|nr:hypothetical protein [Streptomyces spiramenti]NJP66185.1 hypothetical protein [Streptomyces spiramenti]